MNSSTPLFSAPIAAPVESLPQTFPALLDDLWNRIAAGLNGRWPPCGEYGITCNGICPGYFETDLTSSILRSEEFVVKLNSRVPLRSWGRPRDLAGVAVFLASDAGSYVSGQQIIVDGGFTTTI